MKEKQKHILKISESLFAKYGFGGTSVRMIAKEAGINIAMISYYFGSKEKLLETLISERLTNFRLTIQEAIEKEDNYFDKVHVFVALLLLKVHEGRKIHKVIQLEFSRNQKKLDFSNFLDQKRENFKFFIKLIKEGQEKGIFNKEANPELIMPTILGSYFNIYYNKKMYCNVYQFFSEENFDEFVTNTLTKHVQKTIKALLTYES
ncbi:TetR/AcrR family transcriptional regulator [Zunongwangia sp.]|uniref:TetR/AcrR family transcriptional regulator n=1 Tax=Zunongwangia sp. TaxID=1965325 RepID=UPI003AA8A09C